MRTSNVTPYSPVFLSLLEFFYYSHFYSILSTKNDKEGITGRVLTQRHLNPRTQGDENPEAVIPK